MSSSFTLSSVGNGLGREGKHGRVSIRNEHLPLIKERNLLPLKQVIVFNDFKGFPQKALLSSCAWGSPGETHTCYPKSAPALPWVPADLRTAGDMLMWLSDPPPATYLQGHPMAPTTKPRSGNGQPRRGHALIAPTPAVRADLTKTDSRLSLMALITNEDGDSKKTKTSYIWLWPWQISLIRHRSI